MLYPQRRVGKKGEGRLMHTWAAAVREMLRVSSDRRGEPAVILPYSYAGTRGKLMYASLTGDSSTGSRDLLGRTICESRSWVASDTGNRAMSTWKQP